MPSHRPLACAAVLAALFRCLPVVSADCVLTQTDVGAGSFTYPVPKGTKPQPMTIPRSSAVCPEYYDSSCCSPVQVCNAGLAIAVKTDQAELLLSLPSQNFALGTNMKALAAAFNDTAAGGCPACFQNLVNFWCVQLCGGTGSCLSALADHRSAPPLPSTVGAPSRARQTRTSSSHRTDWATRPTRSRVSACRSHLVSVGTRLPPAAAAAAAANIDTVNFLAVNLNTNYSCAVFGSCSSTEKVRINGWAGLRG